MSILEIEAWKTVKIGTLRSAQNARRQLEVAGVRLNFVDNMGSLEWVLFESEEKTLNLAQVSVRDFGLDEGASITEIYDAAKHHGLSLCPAEVALQLCLQYEAEDLLPFPHWAYVAMTPFTDESGCSSVFNILHVEDTLDLSEHICFPPDGWVDSDRWIFVRK